MRMRDILGHHSPKVMRRITGAVLAALLLLTSLPTQSASNVGATTTGINTPVQTAVAEQLSAFKSRNSAQAYSLVSDTFREKYKSPLRFATMMRLNHWELYNHSSYKFLGQSHVDGAEIQKVEITDKDGLPYIYLFRLSQSVSGSWLIDSVIMLDPAAQPV